MALRVAMLALLPLRSCASEVALADKRVVAGDVQRNAESDDMTMNVDTEMDTFVTRFLERSGKDFPSQTDMTDMAERKVSPKIAIKILEGKLPDDVQGLVQAGVEKKSHQPFEESSLAKARRYLNEMMFKAWGELDDNVIACKVFEDKSRGAQAQISTDIARLGEQIADLERIKATAIENINTKDEEIRVTYETIKKEKSAYMKVYLPNKREMRIRRADMAVFQFMMVLTKCKGTGAGAPAAAAALTQLHGHRTSGAARICETAEGLTIDFDDKAAEEKLERMMTPSARAAVQELLSSIDVDRAREEAAALKSEAAADGEDEEVAFLQVGGGRDDDSDDDEVDSDEEASDDDASDDSAQGNTTLQASDETDDDSDDDDDEDDDSADEDAQGSSNLQTSGWHNASAASNASQLAASQLVPGSTVALHCKVHNRFLRMNNRHAMDTCCKRNVNAFPRGWQWEKFRVVEAGNGEIALHSRSHRRFVKPSGKDMMASPRKGWRHLPKNWDSERFKVVDAGNGQIALHNKKHNRFIRMHGSRMDASDPKPAKALPKEWTWERFTVVMVRRARRRRKARAPKKEGQGCQEAAEEDHEA